MRKLKTYALLMFGLGLFNRAAAQDFHMSQYDASPHYFNPALTGMYAGGSGDYRVYMAYRSQWKVITSQPYTNAYIAYDMPYKEKWGVGGYIINNNSGPGSFNSLNVMLSGAYNIIRQKDSPHHLSAGLQLGMLHKSFNPDKLTFATQYDASTGELDPETASGENFDRTGMIKLDGAMGVFYKYHNSNSNWHPFIGYGVYHLTIPDESFTGTIRSQIPLRWTVSGGCEIKVNDDMRLTPKFLYMTQAKAYEINFGMLAAHRLGEGSLSALLGFDYRWKDAVIIHAGLQKDNHAFRISYDVNTSYLKNYTGGRGAIEFSLILTGIKGKPLFGK